MAELEYILLISGSYQLVTIEPLSDDALVLLNDLIALAGRKVGDDVEHQVQLAELPNFRGDIRKASYELVMLNIKGVIVSEDKSFCREIGAKGSEFNAAVVVIEHPVNSCAGGEIKWHFSEFFRGLLLFQRFNRHCHQAKIEKKPD